MATVVREFHRHVSLTLVDRLRFDQKYRVDTAGKISLREVYISCACREFGVWYDPISPIVLRHVLRIIDVHRYSQFVDCVSGKGRVLLVVSESLFEVIRGVEFPQDLYMRLRKRISVDT